MKKNKLPETNHRNPLVIFWWVAAIAVALAHYSRFQEWYNNPKQILWIILLGFFWVWGLFRSQAPKKASGIPLILISYIGVTGLLVLIPTSWPYYQLTSLSVHLLWAGTALASSQSDLRLEDVFKILHRTGTVVAAFAVMGWVLMTYFHVPFHPWIHKISSIGNSAYTAQVLVLSIPAGMALLVSAFQAKLIKGRWGSTLLGAEVALQLIIFFLCNSRAGILAMVVMAGFAALRWSTPKRRLATVLAGVTLVAAVASFGPTRQKFANVARDLTVLSQHPDGWGFEQPLSNTFSRIAFNLNGLEIIREHSLVGIGPGQWINYYPLFSAAKARDPEFTDIAHVSHPHSEYLSFLTERGLLIGLLSILLLGLMIANSTDPRVHLLGLGFATQAFLDFNLMNPVSGFMFALLAGWSVAQLQRDLPFWRKRLEWEPRQTAIFGAVLLVLCWPLARKNIANFSLGKAHITEDGNLKIEHLTSALEMNPFEVEAYQTKASVYLSLARMPALAQKSGNLMQQSLASLHPTRSIVAFFPHPFQNSARLATMLNNNDLAFKFYRISELILPTSISTPIEIGRLMQQSPEANQNRFEILYAEHNRFKSVHFRQVHKCWRTWAQLQVTPDCPGQ